MRSRSRRSPCRFRSRRRSSNNRRRMRSQRPGGHDRHARDADPKHRLRSVLLDRSAAAGLAVLAAPVRSGRRVRRLRGRGHGLRRGQRRRTRNAGDVQGLAAVRRARGTVLRASLRVRRSCAWRPGCCARPPCSNDASSPNGKQLADHFDLPAVDSSAGAAFRMSGPANPVAAWTASRPATAGPAATTSASRRPPHPAIRRSWPQSTSGRSTPAAPSCASPSRSRTEPWGEVATGSDQSRARGRAAVSW